ncbi:MAG TPA: hypothetical protein VF008_29870 [Niastella sp.]
MQNYILIKKINPPPPKVTLFGFVTTINSGELIGSTISISGDKRGR